MSVAMSVPSRVWGMLRDEDSTRRRIGSQPALWIGGGVLGQLSEILAL